MRFRLRGPLDVNAVGEREYEPFLSPYPNSILSWIRLLPGSKSADELVPVDPETGRRPGWVTVYVNADTFRDGDGRAVPVWVVGVSHDCPYTHFAAAFRSRKKAAGLVAELLASED